MSKPNTTQREQTLAKLVETKRRQLDNAPPGYLRIVPIRGNTRYYHVQFSKTKEGERTSTYLSKKNDFQMVRRLAQKAYDARVLKTAEQELRAWEALARYFPDMSAEEVYATLSPARQKLVTPIRLTDEEYRAQWEAVTWEPGYFKPESPYYKTDRGERVRSKSEQLIANLLYRLGIPYRYEYPVTVLVDGQRQTWRPDFLILDVRNRKEYYLEHFGLLGDEDYARNAIRKMNVYEENGIYEGSSIIYSFESNLAPLDIRALERKVRRLLHI